MFREHVLSLLLLFFTTTAAKTPSRIPAPSPLIRTAPQSIEFLRRYGYLAGPSGETLEALYDEKSVENAIKEAQLFGGLNQTGILDEETIKLFGSKRCGLPDVVRDVSPPISDREDRHVHHHHDGRHRRTKRFVLSGTSWKKRHLKYFIANSPVTISEDVVGDEVQSALDKWGEYGRLQFSRTNDPNSAELSMGFYRGQHGDPSPFDGKGNVLAHAFYPMPQAGWGLGGDIHFDSDENWSVGRANDPFKDTVDFPTVALHEMGHSLGLMHSAKTGSVMNPYYTGRNTLGDDDVRAMYDLYVTRDFGKDEQTRREEARRESERRENERKRAEAKWQEERKKHDQRQRDQEAAKRRYDDERRREEEERRKYDQRWREQEEAKRRHEGDKRREEDERRKQEKWRRDQEEAKRRYEDGKWKEEEEKMKRRTTPRPPLRTTGRYPLVTTYEGDFESVESHKNHDPTHRIPPTHPPSNSRPTVDNRPADDDGCVGKFDTVAYLRGEIFITKGKMLWRLSEPGRVQNGYPVEIHQFFHLLPKNVKTIDSMYEREDDSSLVMFAGRVYWVFDGYVFSSPRSIDDYGLTANVDRVDAVTSRGGKIYLFSGNRYWTVDGEVSRTVLQRTSPRPISALMGLPDSLDAVLNYKGVTYFFKNDRFWSMENGSEVPVLRKELASDFWLGC